MNFLFKDGDLLDAYNKIWGRVDNLIKKRFDWELVCNEEYLKINIKSYDSKINTNFLKNEIAKEGIHSAVCVSITIDSVCKIDKRYYPQIYLEE